MARHLVRLKLALLAAGLRRGWQQLVGTLLGVVVVLPMAAVGAGALAWLARQPAGQVAVHVTLSALVVLWLVGPPLTFGLDETLDPARLRLLPLSRRQLAVGLLAASAVGVGPLATALLVAGAVAGVAPGGPGALLVVAAGLAHLGLCLVGARLVTTLLSGWLRSRRGQDLLVVVGALSGLALAAVLQLPSLLASRGRGASDVLEPIQGVVDALAVLPSSWAATVMHAAAEGRWLAAGALLAALVGFVGVLAVAWVALLERANETGGGDGRVRADRPLFTGAASLLPRSRLGAAGARELRYLLGEPQLRVQWLVTVVLAGTLLGAGVMAPGSPPGALVLAVAGLAALQGLSSVNAFGADRGAVWLLLSAGRIEPADLAGKNLAGAMLVLPIAGLAAVGLAAISGGWGFVVPALALTVGVLGVCYGVGDLASVLAPFPLPEHPANAWAGRTGVGCATALTQSLAFVVVGLVMLPPALGVLAAVFLAPPWLVVAALLVAGYGLATWWLGVRLAGRVVAGRGPELLSALEG